MDDHSAVREMRALGQELGQSSHTAYAGHSEIGWRYPTFDDVVAAANSAHHMQEALMRQSQQIAALQAQSGAPSREYSLADLFRTPDASNSQNSRVETHREAAVTAEARQSTPKTIKSTRNPRTARSAAANTRNKAREDSTLDDHDEEGDTPPPPPRKRRKANDDDDEYTPSRRRTRPVRRTRSS
ncbi:hypothetical protein C8R45DRAFT_1038715 [Mycena sanguinolenta]|nr:hypothetical protein C8R45DRAFT_1038715 [Mycena sanguinolenta]